MRGIDLWNLRASRLMILFSIAVAYVGAPAVIYQVIPNGGPICQAEYDAKKADILSRM
jgi:hypothetical protein